MTQLSPSVLAGDLTDLAGAVRAVERGGATMLHLDIMDGHFVPNLTFGCEVVRAIAGLGTSLDLDAHLMVERPEDYIPGLLDAGVKYITVHQEAGVHLHRRLAEIRQGGAIAGVALNPGTPLAAIGDLFEALDMILIMSVDPGFAGQSFIGHCLGKAVKAREMIDASGREILLQMDGGIKLENLREVLAAGLDSFVSGSGVYGADDVEARTREFIARLKEYDAEAGGGA
jgi:ribulose-phosphate 3-epimerase